MAKAKSKKKSYAITAMISTGLLAVGFLFTNAHNAPLDDLGCHRDPPKGKYHCHTGVLKGREFASREEAEKALPSLEVVDTAPPPAVAPAETPAAAAPPPVSPKEEALIKIVTWNLKRKGAKAMDYDRIAAIASEADIVLFQSVDAEEKGKGTLHIVGDLVQTRVNEKICRAWFKNGAGKRDQYGLLWKSSAISLVESSGEIKDSCGDMAVILPTSAKKKDEKVIASSMFFSKAQKKMFTLGTINMDSRPKKPEFTVPSLFKTLNSSPFAAIVGGDFKVSSKHAGFNEVKKMKFKPALTGGGKSSTLDNFWVKNAVVVRAVSINLHDRFSEIGRSEIDSTVSEAFPVLAEFALVPEADENLQMVIVQRAKKEQEKAAAKKEAKAKPVAEAKPAPSFEEPKEDIEEEANEADEEHRGPAAKSTKKKSSKKKSQPTKKR